MDKDEKRERVRDGDEEDPGYIAFKMPKRKVGELRARGLVNSEEMCRDSRKLTATTSVAACTSKRTTMPPPHRHQATNQQPSSFMLREE